MRWNTIGILALAAAVAAGCTTVRTNPADYKSVIDFSRAMVNGTSPGPVDRALNVAIGTRSSVSDPSRPWNAISGNWCARLDGREGAAAVRPLYDSYCKHSGGVYRGDYCLSTVDARQVLFMARVEQSNKCTPPSMSVLTTVVEPMGDPLNEQYIAKLRSLGYMSPEDVDARRANDVAVLAAAQLRTEQERMRREASIPLMRKRGARVCRQDGINTVFGFVDDFTDEKLKIALAGSFVTRTPQYSQSGFVPAVIWDFPTRWTPCD